MERLDVLQFLTSARGPSQLRGMPRMEVRRTVVVEIHRDDDPKEATDGWHSRMVPAAADTHDAGPTAES
jgi:hypothetical protein